MLYLRVFTNDGRPRRRDAGVVGNVVVDDLRCHCAGGAEDVDAGPPPTRADVRRVGDHLVAFDAWRARGAEDPDAAAPGVVGDCVAADRWRGAADVNAGA